MILHVRSSLARFPTSIVYTTVNNASLYFITGMWCPKGWVHWWHVTGSHLLIMIGGTKLQLAIKHQIRLQMHQRIGSSSVHVDFRVRIPFGATKNYKWNCRIRQKRACVARFSGLDWSQQITCAWKIDFAFCPPLGSAQVPVSIADSRYRVPQIEHYLSLSSWSWYPIQLVISSCLSHQSATYRAPRCPTFGTFVLEN